MSYPPVERFRLVNYTFDREFMVLTTNVTESGDWETSVFCNDPETDIKDFESLVEHIISSTDVEAKELHNKILWKWNTLEIQMRPFCL